MNNQSNNWFAVHIQVTADFSRRDGFPQEFLANPCFKLFSSGITLTDEGIAAYFNTSNNPELICAHTAFLCFLLASRSVLRTYPVSPVNTEDWSENWKAFFKPIKKLNKNTWTVGAFQKNNEA
jgi:ribosomal protein L11 methylase PrmA